MTIKELVDGILSSKQMQQRPDQMVLCKGGPQPEVLSEPP